jgi:hypothetical protein
MKIKICGYEFLFMWLKTFNEYVRGGFLFDISYKSEHIIIGNFFTDEIYINHNKQRWVFSSSDARKPTFNFWR